MLDQSVGCIIFDFEMRCIFATFMSFRHTEHALVYCCIYVYSLHSTSHSERVLGFFILTQ